jgi:hypothetical protein
MITGVTAARCDEEFTPPGNPLVWRTERQVEDAPCARGQATGSNIDSAMQGSDGVLKSLIEL